MLKTVDQKTATSLISKAISDLEVEGKCEEKILVNKRISSGKVLLEVGIDVEDEETSKSPNYQGIMRLPFTDSLVKMIDKYFELSKSIEEQQAV